MLSFGILSLENGPNTHYTQTIPLVKRFSPEALLAYAGSQPPTPISSHWTDILLGGTLNACGVTPPSIYSVVVRIRQQPLSLKQATHILAKSLPEQSVLNMARFTAIIYGSNAAMQMGVPKALAVMAVSGSVSFFSQGLSYDWMQARAKEQIPRLIVEHKKGLQRVLPIAKKGTLSREMLAIGLGSGVLAPWMKSRLKEYHCPDRMSTIGAGIGGGALAALISQPFHVTAMKGAGDKKFDQWLPIRVFKEVGFKGLFRGYWGRVLAIISPVTVINCFISPHIGTDTEY